MRLQKLPALLILIWSLIGIMPSDLFAVGEEAPIIALSNNNIYFVSPTSGETRLIVARDPEKDDLMKEFIGYSHIQLSPVSPDNTRFAYATMVTQLVDPKYEPYMDELKRRWPTDLIVVDIATGELTPLTHNGEAVDEMIESDKISVISDPIWSVDGQRLYFRHTVHSLGNRVRQVTIEYYDMVTGERHILTRLSHLLYIRGFYPIPDGLVVVDAEQDQPIYYVRHYSADGTLLRTETLTVETYHTCPNDSDGLIFQLNPILYSGAYHYVYYLADSTTEDDIPLLFNFMTGETTTLEVDVFPTLVSRSHPDTSLRLVFEGLCDYADDYRWKMTDAAGHYIPSTAFEEVEQVTTVALSPDGQSMAYLEPGQTYLSVLTPLIVVDANGTTRKMGLEANQILWGATQFTFTPITFLN